MKDLEQKLKDEAKHWELSVREAFKHQDDYGMWKLLIDEDILCAVPIQKRLEFTQKLLLACFKAGWSFHSLWPSTIWFYPIQSDDIDEKLKEFEGKMAELKEDPFKGIVKVTKLGQLKYTL